MNSEGNVNVKEGGMKGMRKYIFVLVLFLILLPLFMIIKTQREYSHIDESEAEIAIAHYSKIVVTSGHSSTQSIYFTDHECLPFVQASALDALNSLKPGTELKVLIHPNCGICMEIYDGNHTILDFDSSMRMIDRNRNGLLTIYSIMISVGVLFLVVLLASEKKKRSNTYS